MASTGTIRERSAWGFYRYLCHRAWRVLSCLVDYSGLPMSRVKKLPIWLANEGRGFGNWAMRSLSALALEGEQAGEFISCVGM